MRLHHLRIQAFGPFADEVEVDFDELSDAGLFLLTGPTGAGKSSVLDAICFALYGDVPGDRGSANRLRCDQAPPDVAPRVELEATLGGRRLRVSRTARWERPKKRGSGLTTEQASVVISELNAQQWLPLSTRLDEAGHLLTALMGLTRSQFTQVALLPQGEFQAFLRARPEERQALLRHVFATDRFDRIEAWLKQRRLELHRTCADHSRRAAALLERASEAAGAPLPDDWDMSELSPAAESGALTGWLASAAATAHGCLDDLQTAATLADADYRSAGLALDDARRLRDLRRAHAAAQAELAGAELAALPELRDRLARAERARPLADLAAGVAEADDLQRLSRQRFTALATRWSERVGRDTIPTYDELPALLHEASRAVDAVEAVRPEAERRVEIRRIISEVEALATQCDADIATLADQIATAPGALADARAELDTAAAAAATLTAAENALATARAQLAAAHEQADLQPRLRQTVADLKDARTHLVVLKEEWLAIREARLDGMAAEIAGSMAVGAECPVCGSCDHPHLASAATGAPDATAERAARASVDDAEATLTALDDHVRSLEARVAALVVGADGHSPESAEAEVATASAHHSDVVALADTEPALRERVNRLESEASRCAIDLAAARERSAALQERLVLHQGELSRLDSALDAVLADTGAATIGELSRRRQEEFDLLAQACAAAEESHARERAHAEELRALEKATRAAGFDVVDDALTAIVDPEESEHLSAEIEALAERQAAARAVLGDRDHQAAAAAAEPDVAARERGFRDAESARQAHHTALAEAQGRHQRLTTLTSQLTDALNVWEPVRQAWVLADGLSSLTEGRSADNRLQMRLSAFVLAHRLEQVVTAANERLRAMSDRRYALEHSARKLAGETRGGLSLLVRDEWSGESRDPATLSGGETFVVSLALALGLADVITDEAGGARLDTLFVDEGFGSLDSETLEDVMTTLDGLRDGGRIVGVVSHVAEMQDRIPAQLRVAKSREHGSSLRQVVA